MNNIQRLILTLLFLSVASFVLAIICFVKEIIKNKGKSTYQKLIVPTLWLFLSIFLLRYIVGFYQVFLSSLDALISAGYNWGEEIFTSLVRTLQTFSLDESYVEAVVEGKELFISEFDSRFLPGFYGFFTSFLNVCAPIVGGAIFLGILTSLFPRMRLFFMPRREKYVFSELNERAVYLAEDIIREAKKARLKELKRISVRRLPLIVFTDAYIDYDSEASSELLQRAKDIGAICVKDDVLKIPFPKTKKLRYMLVDNEDISNIHTLTALISESIISRKNTCHIHVFSQNPEAGSIIKKLYKDNNLQTSKTIVKIVQEYTSIIYNLLNDVPLYYPLLTKYPQGHTEGKELVFTIIGGGKIGTEAFLGAYWCGQMLNCKLRINVITEDAEKFKAGIDHINPDILLSGLPNHELLRIFPDQDEYAPPYAEFFFYSADVETGELYGALNKKDDNSGLSMLSSDYFVIALGSDELNMTIAANMDRAIRREALNGFIRNMPVIAYSVYDSKTNEMLNSFDPQASGTHYRAFASLKSIYSCKNIFMDYVNDSAYDVSNAYRKTDMDDFLRDEYGWWSSIARALHFNYKVYSTGLLNAGKAPDSTVDDKVKKAYWETAKNDDAVNKALTWLEHRRWNAFMRTKGFSAPTEKQWERYAFNAMEVDSHKHIDLKLHPCIAESSEASQIAEDDWGDAHYMDNARLDFLDIASIKVFQTKLARKGERIEEEYRNFKKYDRPEYDRYVEE